MLPLTEAFTNYSSWQQRLLDHYSPLHHRLTRQCDLASPAFKRFQFQVWCTLLRISSVIHSFESSQPIINLPPCQVWQPAAWLRSIVAQSCDTEHRSLLATSSNLDSQSACFATLLSVLRLLPRSAAHFLYHFYCCLSWFLTAESIEWLEQRAFSFQQWVWQRLSDWQHLLCHRHQMILAGSRLKLSQIP